MLVRRNPLHATPPDKTFYTIIKHNNGLRNTAVPVMLITSNTVHWQYYHWNYFLQITEDNYITYNSHHFIQVRILQCYHTNINRQVFDSSLIWPLATKVHIHWHIKAGSYPTRGQFYQIFTNFIKAFHCCKKQRGSFSRHHFRLCVIWCLSNVYVTVDYRYTQHCITIITVKLSIKTYITFLTNNTHSLRSAHVRHIHGHAHGYRLGWKTDI